MIKVKYSKFKRSVILDFSGEVGELDIEHAEAEMSRVLAVIGKGYTLIEVFHDNPQSTPSAVHLAGGLASRCYTGSRIWRVIRIETSPHADPGMSILHRTRWKREVPELEMDNVREALGVAKEEANEQKEWVLNPLPLPSIGRSG